MFKDNILYVKDLNCSYNRGDPVLHSVSLNVKFHDIICIIGPNGSGKSTLLKALVGLINFEGDLLFKNNHLNNFKEYKRKIAYLPSSPFLYNILTGHENLDLIKNLWNVPGDIFWENVEYYTQKLNMSKHLETRVEEYSEGMKDKLFFIANISREPDLILLDEPFMSWDFYSQQTALHLIKEYVNNNDKAVIIVTHSEQLRKKLANRTFSIQNKTLKECNS